MSFELNGFFLCKHYIPKELLTLILSHILPAQLIPLSLVCEEWNNIIKDSSLWLKIFKRKHPERPVKNVPWYVYYTLLSTDFFDTNLIRKRDWKSTQVWEFHKGPFKIKSWQYDCIKIDAEYFINLIVRDVYSKILKKYKPDIIVQTPNDNNFIDIVVKGTRTGIKSYGRSNLQKINETQTEVNYLINDYPDDIEQIAVFVEVESDKISSLKISFDSIQNI